MLLLGLVGLYIFGKKAMEDGWFRGSIEICATNTTTEQKGCDAIQWKTITQNIIYALKWDQLECNRLDILKIINSLCIKNLEGLGKGAGG